MYLASVLISLCLSAFFAGCRQPEEKKYVIGIANPSPEDKEITLGIRKGMERFGYIEGKNTTYLLSEDSRTVGADIRDMAAKNASLIFTVTTPATKAAQEAVERSKISVVFAMYDPVESGVIKSLSAPGINVTGVQIRGSIPKAIEWLLQAVPRVKHLYVPTAYDTKAARQSIEDIRTASSMLKLRVTVSEVSSVEQLRASLSSIPKDVDAIFIPHSILVVSHLDAVVEAAVRRRLPVASGGHAEYNKGVMISYGNDQLRTGEQAARLTQKILGGTAPANLPAERADFFLGINLRTARSIGMVIPDDVLRQADFVVR